MIRDLLAWWSAQLLELVPARFARPDPSEAGALLVEPLRGAGPDPRPGARLWLRSGGEDPPAMLAALQPGGGAAELAAFAEALSAARGRRALPVLLRLPAASVLRREVEMPLAAEAGLDRVLGYEMDRLTPFSAAETVWSHQVLRRDRAAGRLTLRLALVPRAVIDDLLSLLEACGAQPEAIEVAVAATANVRDGLRIPLAHEAPAGRRRERMLLRAAAGACVALALLAVLLPFLLQQAGLADADRRIARLQPAVRAVQAAEERIAGGSAGATLIRTERRTLGDALSVLASLTAALPDDSYLTDLALRRGQLTVSGQSSAAARLIPLLSADPGFSAPAFSAPVTRMEGQAGELFSIRTGVAH